MKKTKMTGGQLAQTYTIATQQGCGQAQTQFLIENGYMADFFAGDWRNIDREALSALGHSVPKDSCARSNFKVWKKIKLGTVPSDMLPQAVEKAGINIEFAERLLEKQEIRNKVETEEIEVELARVSVAELGFKETTTMGKVLARAKELGLRLCPAEVGPQLAIQYRNQPKDETLAIAMDKIINPDYPYPIFMISARSLHMGSASPSGTIGVEPGFFLVFLLRWVSK
jgi:hypothetical protein